MVKLRSSLHHMAKCHPITQFTSCGGHWSPQGAVVKEHSIPPFPGSVTLIYPG